MADLEHMTQGEAIGLRKAVKSAASKRFVGGNCQRIGPSFGPSSITPVAKNRSIVGPASASTRRCVAKRGALSENTKSSGVSARQRRKLSGRCAP
jgi:hypothetical protein